MLQILALGTILHFYTPPVSRLYYDHRFKGRYQGIYAVTIKAAPRRKSLEIIIRDDGGIQFSVVRKNNIPMHEYYARPGEERRFLSIKMWVLPQDMVTVENEDVYAAQTKGHIKFYK